MRTFRTCLVATLAALPLTGCYSPPETIYEGVTLGAGDAIAHNSALQIIDPWPPGVQDTDLAVPAERGEEADTTEAEDVAL